MNKLGKLFSVSLMTVTAFFSQAYISLAAAPLTGIPTVTQSGASDLIAVIESIGGWILSLAGGIAVLFLIYGGITYMTGGEKGAESGKKIIVNAIIGIAIMALATIIVSFVVTALK